MSCIGTFGSLVGRTEDELVIWELIYELYISYELYKENIKFYELISIYYVYVECKIAFNGLINELSEVGSVLNQK